VVGKIDAIGEGVLGWKIGQRVGVGFLSITPCETLRPALATSWRLDWDIWAFMGFRVFANLTLKNRQNHCSADTLDKMNPFVDS
jgi:hypothetical protein